MDDTGLTSLDPPVTLPDGREFKTWEQPLEFGNTYYVDGSSPAASDDNAGTEAAPFRTIGQALAKALVLWYHSAQ